MTFRDEREALRAQKDALTAELQAKEAALRSKERELEKLRRAIEDQAKEPEAAPPEPPTKPDDGPPFPEPTLRERAWDFVSEHWLAMLGMLVAAGFVIAMLYVVNTTAPEPFTETSTTLASVEVTFPATVSLVEGASPVALGTSCLVTVSSNPDSQLTCHTLVQCGDVGLYGARPNTGFLRCEMLADKTPTSGLDAHPSSEDTDPELVLDLAHQRVEVRDGERAASWGVTLTLAPGTVRREAGN